MTAQRISHRTVWRRYALAAGLVVGITLATFAVVQMAQVPGFQDARLLHGSSAWTAAASGIGLLIADVLLPVPSSGVMTAHGALFGVAVGTMLSLVGNTGAVLAGWLVGRTGRGRLEQPLSPLQRARASALLGRWGPAALIVTRPVPVLAETVTIMAGATGMRLVPVLAAGVAGSLPVALAYAVAGRWAATSGVALLVFIVLVGLALAALLLARRASFRERQAAA
ncbi:MAG: VTT domain-containing protein [Mycobacteriales bacterium]